ncbi:MAG: nicotinamide riboside transporter PnuC, partial [Patescibacteria group bacterium]
ENDITLNNSATNLITIGLVTVLTICLGLFMTDIHRILPTLFPQPAAYPYWDAFTTIMSFAATFLMIRKKIECWYLWIVVDIIGIWLYYQQGVIFISMLYTIFLVIACNGLYTWSKAYNHKKMMN